MAPVVNLLLRLLPSHEGSGCAHVEIPHNQVTGCPRGMWRFPGARAVGYLLCAGSRDLVALSQGRIPRPYDVIVLGASRGSLCCSFQRAGPLADVVISFISYVKAACRTCRSPAQLPGAAYAVGRHRTFIRPLYSRSNLHYLARVCARAVIYPRRTP